MRLHAILPRLFLGIAATLAGLFLLWLFGGLYWLQVVFPPWRPRSMPEDSVWIEAPSLPLSWHHGWWFGCSLSSSGKTNYCRLVGGGGDIVDQGEYLPCRSKSPIPEQSIELVAPSDSVNMWIPDPGLPKLTPAGFLKNGDILLPVAILDHCDKIKAEMRR